ncbi:Type I restriction modification DNA specificity domain-containing protein [Chitinophaga ginsengisegetis]|uniref:Type I restriction modification DNA specificity domain-containing protein n=1 Tax=Chitinophaga ginsengisegetis TaxID=393003 RepID=A0A1T5NAQ8_9BACT|nr:restriction endonuclease subunit S [Chitinophaga ginsengisegetis]SKC97550.1 Type I restriction modification DNA specificity domain-containing protein [Chitinophaga ginsengisegetis]
MLFRLANSEDGELYFDKYVKVKESYREEKRSELLQKGEVLFNNTNSQEWVGKSALFDLEGDYLCSNHITRIGVKRDIILPEYLWIILNLYQRHDVFYNICTNWNNQSGVNIELLKSVKIPVPSIEEQELIIEINRKRITTAKELRKEADKILEEGKDKIEKLILN